jgi:hypothetical protein
MDFAVAKVIALYVPNTFGKPPKGVPKFQRGKLSSSADRLKNPPSDVSLESCHEFD